MTASQRPHTEINGHKVKCQRGSKINRFSFLSQAKVLTLSVKTSLNKPDRKLNLTCVNLYIYKAKVGRHWVGKLLGYRRPLTSDLHVLCVDATL